MIGLNEDLFIFGKFLLVLTLFNLVAAAECLIIGAAFKQVALANLVASLTMLFSMLFGGFLLNKGQCTARVERASPKHVVDPFFFLVSNT
jgi:hypothetical protein